MNKTTIEDRVRYMRDNQKKDSVYKQKKDYSFPGYNNATAYVIIIGGLERSLGTNVSGPVPARTTSTNYFGSKDEVAIRNLLSQYAHEGFEKKHDDYVAARGGRSAPIVATGASNLGPRTIAAIAVGDDHSRLIANYNIEARIAEFAAAHGTNYKTASVFVLNHEKTHAAGIRDEIDVFRHDAQMYHTFAQNARSGEEQEMYQDLMRISRAHAEQYAAMPNEGRGQGGMPVPEISYQPRELSDYIN